jgi:hypothetical protein
MSRKKTPNPHCPVAGCRTKQPHTDEFLVKALVDRFAAPDKCLTWVLAGMVELLSSVIDDILEKRLFGWYTRMRPIEELYFKTLYIMLLAPENEVPHLLSGDPPNSLSQIYDKVNEHIMERRGELTDAKPGLVSGEFKMIDNLHDAAHVGFGAMQMVVNIAQNPEYTPNMWSYIVHVSNYCARIDYMRRMFEGGKDKTIVLEAFKNMHRPKEYWEQKAREAREAAQASSSDVTFSS